MSFTIVQIDFPHQGPWGEEMTSAYGDLARSIAEEPGLVFKYWTENRREGRAGGVYGFRSRPEAEAYVEMHAARMRGWGVADMRAMTFDVNAPLSQIDMAPHVAPEVAVGGA